MNRKRVGTVIRQIHTLFESKKRVLAKEALAVLPGSIVTIGNARRYLGVKTRIIAGKHTWLAPTNTLESALKKAQRSSRSTIYRLKKSNYAEQARNLMSTFLSVMEASHFDITSKDLKEELKRATGRTWPNGVITAVKRETKVITILHEKHWRVLFPSDEVESWIEKTLGASPVLEKDLFLWAKRQEGYSELLINQFRTGHGFATFKKEEDWYWYNGNLWSPK